MIKVNRELRPEDLLPQIERMWELSARKIESLRGWEPCLGSPVYTVNGRYTTRGWTEWTQGFQYGSAILQFDATGDEGCLKYGRENTIQRMASHITHMGVHDHGFNNISTYGNLWRLMKEGRLEDNQREMELYELALKASGAVQARRWTVTADKCGFIYSFNGPHSLFVDTIRSLRVLAMAHKLEHVLLEERDQEVSLLQRLIHHAITTADYSIYYGEGRDIYDVRGRVAHESIFNVNDGSYRCPSSQQGYSPFTTWTRGLAWAVLGFAEQLEYLYSVPTEQVDFMGSRTYVEETFSKAAQAAADYYLQSTPVDGVPYWDTGAPNLHRLGEYLDKPADPHNEWEPVDSSAAAIASQGLMRLGFYLQRMGHAEDGKRYFCAGLTVLQTLLGQPYLSDSEEHQGLLLHSIYHRPNGWDQVPEGAKSPSGESSMWGDYHLREAALYAQRLARQEPYYTFFGPPEELTHG